MLSAMRALPAALLLAAILAAPASRADLLVLRYGQSFSAEQTIYALPVHIAQRQGFFTREGLEFRQFFIPGGGDKMIDALHDDTVELTHVATAFLIESALKGSDAVAIATEFNNPIYSLVAKPEIRAYADLKDRLVGLADEAGTITLSIRRLLAANGLAGDGYRVRVISGTPARVGCLKRGDCVAVPLGQPQDITAAREGYRILGRSDEATPAYVYTVTAARRSWAAAHPDLVTRYVRALASAFAFIRDESNLASVIGVVMDDTRCSDADARDTLRLYLNPERNVLPTRGEIDRDAFARTIALMGDGGQLTPPLPPVELFVDAQYLRAAGVE